MNIEIYGALFKNKGAELMLRSICEKVENNYENGNGIVSFSYKYFFDFNNTDILKRRFPGLSKVLDKTPSFILNKFKSIKNADLDYVLDASGFAYGDQWGLETSKYTLKQIKEWKALGCGVTLLPQAFGSFEKPGMKEAIKEIHKEVDFMFVRDKVSLKYVHDVIGPSDKVELATDFTNLIEGVVPKTFNDKNGIAIIPNCRMLDKTENSDTYVKLLEDIANHFISKGLNPFFLIHEGEDDLKIANDINTRITSKIPVYFGYNALEIKGVIGQSKFVVSSRFHGLVSALSQGIPCLGTGWSHKYKCLFEDYEYNEGLIELNNWTTISDVLTKSLDTANYNATKTVLLKNSKRLKQESQDTWNKVFSIIDNHKNKISQ